MRDGLLFLHIAGVAGWLGGGMFFVFASTSLMNGGEEGAGKAISRVITRAGWFFGPVTAVVLLSGIALVLDSAAWGWDDTFVWIGIGAIVVSGIWQGVVGGKLDQEFAEAAAAGGPSARAVFMRWRRLSIVDFAILAVAVWAMIAKFGA